MKILVENHFENDRITRERNNKRLEELHTTKCEHCNAILHFPDEAVSYISSRDKKEYMIECPCCLKDTSIGNDIVEEINTIEGNYNFVQNARRSYIRSNRGNNEPPIEVIKDGNFHMELTCSNCQSKLQFDYRDCKYEPVVNPNRIRLADYPSFGYTIKCPVCGKILLVQN